MKAIIFIAHGSKKDQSNNEFVNLIEKVSKEDTKYNFKKAAFLELSTPCVQEVAVEFIKKDVKDISFYPYFLNSGKHVLIDLPNIIENLKKEYPLVEFKLLSHFGKSEKIKDIILSDI